MKKTLLTVLAAAALVATSYGQGTVTFANGTGSVINYQAIGGGPIVAAPSSAAVQAELMFAPAGTTDVGLFTPIAGLANVGSPTAGRFSGGVRTVPTAAPGGLAQLFVRAFVGTDWANATHRGASVLFQVDTGDPTTTPAGTPFNIATSYGSFVVSPVPEPSSMALAGLGAASLLIFRRRK